MRTSQLRQRFLLVMGASGLLASACDKDRVVVQPPPPSPRADCTYGAAQLRAGQAAAPMPFHQCPAQREVYSECDGSLRGAFDETETRVARQRDATACCYAPVHATPCPPRMRGRAFRIAPLAAASTAPIRERSDWTRVLTAALPDAATCDRLAHEWLEDARAEHASVASFALLALQLMQLGAPPDLIRDAHLAALDEIRHAEICFALASTYANAPLGPGPLDTHGTVTETSLAQLATATLDDGCFGETTAALEAHEASKLAADPVVRAALEGIAEDESRHAELGWRIVAWTVRAGGADVQRILIERARELEVGPPPNAPNAPNDLARHGRLSPQARRSIAAQCIREVVVPCIAALS